MCLAAGKGKAKANKEPSAKEKMKQAKAAALQKKKERAAALKAAEESMQASAKAAGMDYDDWLKEKEDKEDDAMRARCKAVRVDLCEQTGWHALGRCGCCCC